MHSLNSSFFAVEIAVADRNTARDTGGDRDGRKGLGILWAANDDCLGLPP